MLNKVEQNNNSVTNGDIVAGNKEVYYQNIIIKKEIEPTKRTTIRNGFDFKINADEDNTTLTSKLKNGEVNKSYIDYAIGNKVKCIDLLISLSKTKAGKEIVGDLYDNLLTAINSQIISLNPEDLLKTKMEDIRKEFSRLSAIYVDLIEIDESILFGLLFIATSNCAIKWRIE